jgi:putative transposase
MLGMPKDVIRYQQTGDLHFVTFSCYQRRPYLGTPAMRELFEESLEKMRVKYDFHINAYVVMPEHVHLLVSEPKRAILAKAIQALKISLSVQQKERPFWMARYHDFNVYTDHKFRQKVKYTHRNPVSRGLVEEPEHWAWSSFRHYSTGVPGTVEVESAWVARARELARANTHISEARCGAPGSEGRP